LCVAPGALQRGYHDVAHTRQSGKIIIDRLTHIKTGGTKSGRLWRLPRCSRTRGTVGERRVYCGVGAGRGCSAALGATQA
jgi:hypothetical protein